MRSLSRSTVRFDFLTPACVLLLTLAFAAQPLGAQTTQTAPSAADAATAPVAAAPVPAPSAPVAPADSAHAAATARPLPEPELVSTPVKPAAPEYPVRAIWVESQSAELRTRK